MQTVGRRIRLPLSSSGWRKVDSRARLACRTCVGEMDRLELWGESCSLAFNWAERMCQPLTQK
jgi:hypothetical protein